ncbi:LOW QUALITY PROTEIN: solute carrier family 13 member 1-like [Narcine bancroftii]|uniref:LOW QUALITY PROTEIN: solute carrier family 13 member 1-like n=1 Tax=Narcine bancroftii TaxID=1343680 RepID=UPI0038315F1D
MSFLRHIWCYQKLIIILFFPLLILPLPLIIKTKESECTFTTLVVVMYWLTEAMPLSATALLPALVFPLFGIVRSSEVASAYFKDFHILLIGIICLATSIAKWNLHKRIALRMVLTMGVNPGRAPQYLRYLVSRVFLSTQVMKEEAVSKYKSEKDHNLCKGMCLCVAYSSTIGGLTTITGTSTNLIFAEQFIIHYPDQHCINFGSSFILVFPMTVIIMVLSWVWLHVIYFGFSKSKTFQFRKEKSNREKASIKLIEEEYKKLGPMGTSFLSQEIVTLVIFCFMAMLWFTRNSGFFPGWSNLFPQYKGFATDSTVALLLGILCFVLPAENPAFIMKETGEKEYSTLITWKEFQSCMPWEISLLIGGGFALAKGSEVSGLSFWVGSKLEPLSLLPEWVIVLVSCLIVTSVTEVASNPATITIFLPILVALSEAIHINPLYLLIPSTLCTSFAFLLPVSNPPNAIVFGYGHLTIMDRVRFYCLCKSWMGKLMSFGFTVVMLAISTWAIPLFDLKAYPSWAQDVRNATIP